MNKKLQVGILGATGTVGQRLIQLLENHPWFKVKELGASDHSIGQKYREACHWRVSESMPEFIQELPLRNCRPPFGVDLIFSVLPSSIAGQTELSFARAGYPVVSNSKNHRMAEDVPLLVPEVNPKHLELIPIQQKKRGFGSGFVITNPNCTTIALILVLAPLVKVFGLKEVSVVTMQALSGAGYPGVPSLDMIDNVLPYIEGEEEKVEQEPLKILGKYQSGKIIYSDFKISAQCHRVNVQDGHLEAVSVKFNQTPSKSQLIEVLSNCPSVDLPSAPRKPVIYLESPDRPQPRLDRNLGSGMSVAVGRIRPCSVFDYKFELLCHNTIRGAAGAAVLNAELLYKKKLLIARQKG
tara:strand:+ start:1792 stop:2850 length:1059 start_codon:yes stop_codon:yes gene_type:complete